MIEEKLKDLILSKFKSIREFSNAIGLPYTTVDSILRRGIEKANILNIIKICDVLNIDTEELSKGNIVNKKISDSYKNFDSEKEQILEFYDKFSDPKRKELLNYALYLSTKNED